MKTAKIKDLTERVINRAHGLFPDISRERIQADILNAPLLEFPDKVVGYISQGHIAIFFSVPFSMAFATKTTAYDIGKGVEIVNGFFEFTDSCGMRFRILANTDYEVLN